MKKSVYKVVLFVLLVSSLTTLAKEPVIEHSPSAKITGKVADLLTGEPLAGVAISVEGTDQKIYTDLEGNFIIDKLSPGKYNLIATLVSYKNSLVEIQLNADKENKVDLKMNNN